MTSEEMEFIEKIVIDYTPVLEQYGRRCVSYKENLYPCIEDALQQTYLKAVKHVKRLMRHENVIGWLKLSLYHDLMHQIRSLRSSKEFFVSDADVHGEIQKQRLTNALMDLENKPTLKEVKEAVLDILSSDEQMIFHEYFLNDCTLQETSQKTNLSCGSVRGKIRNIRRKLKIYFFLCVIYSFIWTI